MDWATRKLEQDRETAELAVKLRISISEGRAKS